MAKLHGALDKAVDRKGWLLGLDGRRLPIRSKHSALNTLLQGAGGAVAKTWMVYANRMVAEDLPPGVAQQLAYVHDELQWQVRPEYTDQLKDILTRAAAQAGEDLGFRLPVDIGLDTGSSWAETH